MTGTREFPRLTADNHRVTSPATEEYNCIAWSAGDTERWWQPGVYWPVPATTYDREVLVQAFLARGYEPCPDGALKKDLRRSRCTPQVSSTLTPHANSRPAGGRASSAATWTSSTTRPTPWPADCTARCSGS